MLLTEVLGSIDQVGQGRLDLFPGTGLETAVRVDPELLRAEVLQHLRDTLLDLLLRRDTRSVDIVDTRSDMTGVGLVNEDLEELSIGTRVLNGENISVESSNGVEEVLELRVTEVRVDLSGVLNTSGGELEAVHGPLQVSLTLLAGAERETLTESGLIDLDDEDTVLLKVNNLVAESESELHGLDGLVDVVTREGPSEASDGSSEHTLHGLLGDGSGVLALLDGHGSRTRDVTDNDGGTHATRSVRLDPSVGGEDVTLQALTEVLNHIVTLRLTVNVDIEAELVLDLDGVVNFLADESIVLLFSDLSLGELVTLDTDLLGLGEGADGGGGEKRQAQVSPLLSVTGVEAGLTVVQVRGDLGETVLDLGVVGALGLSARLLSSSVGIELGLDRGGSLGGSLGENGNFLDLLNGEGKPLVDFLRKLLFASESVRDVEERAGGGDDDAVLAKGRGGGVNDLKGLGKVVLPDVTSVDNTEGKSLLRAESLDDGLELLRVTDEVDVESVETRESGDSVDVVNDITEVGGNGELRASGSKSFIGRLESSLDLGLQVENEDGLIDLDTRRFY